MQKLYSRAKIGLYATDDTEIYEFCQPDGYYARIQQNDTHKFCSDKSGNRISNYAAILGSPEANTMTCSKTKYFNKIK